MGFSESRRSQLGSNGSTCDYTSSLSVTRLGQAGDSRFWSMRSPVSLSIFVTQGLLLGIAGWQHSHSINPDAVSYLRIAQYYLEGNSALAISGCWGPLFSWLIMPFLAVGATPLLAARLAMGISALIFLLGALHLFRVVLEETSAVFLASLTTAL